MTDSPLWQQTRWQRALQKNLVAWFQRHARDLPWRREPTAYRIWVSEIMLQQTQVVKVHDYYLRFMERFPTVAALAAAEEQELMRLWEGLGYYRRARLMHQAAKQVVELHGGEFPCTPDEVFALPGVGRYTGGAILSIACQQPLPILEGNTVRVFSRLAALQEDVKSKAGVETLWSIAAAVVPAEQPGVFNQAAMELGALICKPTNPACEVCPVSSQCQAYKLGLQGEIPGRVTRIQYESRREYALLIPDRRKRWLVYQVPAGQRWAGLWDFPRITAVATNSAQDSADQIGRETGLQLTGLCQVATFKHAVTKYRITLEVYRTQPAAAKDLLPTQTHYRFATSAEIGALPLSVTGRRIAELLPE